jgi:hypothetical protein
MRLYLAILLVVTACAQETAPKKDAASKNETGTTAPVESPVPTTESWFTGSMDVGYRWRTDVGGNLDSYRSVVDLGSGPKLLGVDFSVTDPGKRLFDRLDVRAQNWGDDPYSTAHVAARKDRIYEFSADYRNMAYFNALPSFANPLLSRGLLFSERSFDIRRRMAALQLDLKPGSRIIPYIAYERSSGSGRGVTTFVSDANEYPVPNLIRDSHDTYRGGVRLEFGRFHATGEIGGTVFKDDQQIFESSAGNQGNRETSFLGQRLFLTNLQQSYGVRGSGVFSKFLFTSNALSWLDVYGNVLYSRPETDTNYQQFNSGNFAIASAALFVTTQQFALASQARMPHTAGSAGAEIRPWRRTRVMVSWLTDRLENTGTANFSSLLRNEYNQSDVDLIVDATRQITLRGGYRYVWGDARTVITPAAGLLGAEDAELRRHVGKGGFTYRPAARLSISADVEAAASSRVYFRTSLNDYQRLRVRGRYQATNTLAFAADVAFLNNQNPTPGIDYDFTYRNSSVSALWTPASAKRILLQASYSRSTIRSDTMFIAPQFFERERSLYRDNAHTVDGRVDLVLPPYSGMTPRLSLGGAFFWASGSRPTQHYLPLGSLNLPVTKTVAWISEWRYHGFGESFYGFESFRTHLVTTGIRVSR